MRTQFLAQLRIISHLSNQDERSHHQLLREIQLQVYHIVPISYVASDGMGSLAAAQVHSIFLDVACQAHSSLLHL